MTEFGQYLSEDKIVLEDSYNWRQCVIGDTAGYKFGRLARQTLNSNQFRDIRSGFAR